MKKMKSTLLLLLCISILSGCWDSNEPERLVYANGLGIDYKDGKVIVYLQIINVKGLAKSESSGDPSTLSQADVGRATGNSLDEAIFNLYHTSDRRIYWGHLSFVIFSEEALKAGGLKYATDFLDRYRETRYRIFFFMTKDSIKDALLISPIENISMAFSKLSDPDGNYNQSSFIPPINLRELIIELDEPAHQVAIPLLKITEQWTGQNDKKKDLLIERVVIISENKIKTILPRNVMNGGRWINKHFVRDSLTLFPETKNDAFVVIYDKKIKIIPAVEKNGKVHFDIKMKLKASVEMMIKDISRKQYEKEIKRAIKKEINNTYQYTQKRDIDLFRLTETLYRKDNKAWKKIEIKGGIPLEEDTLRSIQIDVEIQDTGKHRLTPIFDEQKDKGIEDK
ncbi:Ger(x)C family spore germination protein [Peribacillus butanolivorans]|uniref:Ger(x)C family spore germination protein n=1 Tax=Peribacillus butanolivorans TaxID=421767 RepID=UPI002E2096F6|nr:Ger(x)C family spore germination protein [Peribacillus butanolivorans]MED3689052.1 Ger(x)C family spore germination protein [Peribacillus butanolivorans]